MEDRITVTIPETLIQIMGKPRDGGVTFEVTGDTAKLDPGEELVMEYDVTDNRVSVFRRSYQRPDREHPDDR